MIMFDEAARLVRLQERLAWATREALKEDGHHKSDEAMVEVIFALPGMFHDDKAPYWRISVYSYVLGPRRNHDFLGKSLAEALAVAESAVSSWVEPYEFRQFEHWAEHGVACSLRQPVVCNCGVEEERRRQAEEADDPDAIDADTRIPL